jgi:hypothetical protein
MTAKQAPRYKPREIVGIAILIVVLTASLVALDWRVIVLSSTGLIYLVGRRLALVVRSKPVLIYRQSSRSGKVIFLLLLLVFLQLPIVLLSDWHQAHLPILIPGLIIATAWLVWLLRRTWNRPGE